MINIIHHCELSSFSIIKDSSDTVDGHINECGFFFDIAQYSVLILEICIIQWASNF